MFKKFYIYIFIFIYIVTSINLDVHAINSSNNVSKMNYIFDDEELKQQYFKQLSKVEVDIQKIGLTKEEEAFLKSLRKNNYYYILNNANDIGKIDEKYYTMEALLINEINRVLKTNISVVGREELNLNSVQDIAEIVRTNDNFFSSVYTFNVDNTLSSDFLFSDFYANKDLFIVSHNMDLINEYDKAFKREDIIGKVAISVELENIAKLLNYDVNNFMVLTPEKAKEKLNKREIDYYICEINTIHIVTEKSSLQYKFFESEVDEVSNAMSMFYTNTENEQFISIINKILREIDKSILREYYYLYKYYKAGAVFENALTDEEKIFLKNLDSINAGIFDLKSLTEVRGKKIYGYTADTLSIISKLLDIEIQYNDITDKNYIKLFLDDEIDLIPYMIDENADEIYKDFKEIGVDIGITDYYIRRKFEILKQMDTEDLVNLDKLNYVDVGVLSSLSKEVHYYLKSSVDERYGNVKEYDTVDEMMLALNNGEIKYAISTPGTSAFYEKEISLNERIQLAYDVSLKFNEENFKWVMLVSEGEDTDILVNIINKALQVVDFKVLSNYWFDYSLNFENFENLKRRNEMTTFLISTIGLLGVLIIFLLVNRNIKSTREMTQIAKVDNLTGLLNKAALFDTMKNVSNYYAILIDIKEFKNINDVYGIIIADEVLISVAEKIKKVQVENKKYNIKSYRLEKDEFIIIVENSDTFKEQEFLINLVDKLKEVIEIKNLTFKLEYSVNAICSNYAEDDFKKALVYVNNMKLKNKTQKPAPFVIFDDKQHDGIKEYIKIEKALYNVTEDNILPFFQPFIDVKTGAVKGCEVLARLYLDGVIYAPFKFIPVAERNGLLDDIDRLLFRRTLNIRNQLLKQGVIDENFYFSLNISAQFLKELSIEYLDNIMVEFKLKDFTFLQMEVLEEKLTDEEAKKIFEIVSARNIKSAVDDFSTGYSSLSRLVKNFKFKVLKIDKSLLPIKFTEKDKSVYKAIVDVVKKLNMSIVSEGVETREHAEFLSTIDIDTFQGYYFAKPLPLEEFKQYIVINRRDQEEKDRKKQPKVDEIIIDVNN